MREGPVLRLARRAADDLARSMLGFGWHLIARRKIDAAWGHSP